MQRWMSPVRFALAPALLRSLAVGRPRCSRRGRCPGGVAAADEPAGTTVVGRLVQAWPEAAGPARPRPPARSAGCRTPTATPSASPPTTSTASPPARTVQVTVGAAGRRRRAEDPLHQVLDAEIVAPARPTRCCATRPASPTRSPSSASPPTAPPRDGVTVQQLVDLVDGPVADFWSEQSDGAIAVGVTAASATGSRRPPAAPTRPRCGTRSPRRSASSPAPAGTCCSTSSSAATGLRLRAGRGRLRAGDRRPAVRARHVRLGDRPRARATTSASATPRGSSATAAVESAACRTVAYRDYYDVMGVSWAQLGSLNAAQAARLGVLPAAQQQALTRPEPARPRSPSRRSPAGPAPGRCGSPTPTASTTGSSTGRRPAATPGSGRRPTATGCRPASCCAGPAGCPTPRCCSTARPTAAAGWNGDLQDGAAGRARRSRSPAGTSPSSCRAPAGAAPS